MYSKYQELTAFQAAGLFARQARGTISTFYLSRMMYFFEREVLRKTGWPLFSADMITTETGISLVQVDEGIHSIKTGKMTSQWPRYFYQKSETEIHLCEDPGEVKVSLSNTRLLQQIYQRFNNFTNTELKDYFTHLPEYKKNDIGLTLTRKELIRAFEISANNLNDRQRHFTFR